MKDMASVRTDKQRADRRAYYAANKERENAMARARHAKNRDKNIAKQRAWAAANPGHWRKARKYPEPTRPKPATCELCGRAPKAHGLCLDHDHMTNQFRGWLCSPCNRAIGALGDGVEGLMRAVRYLQKSIPDTERGNQHG
jgi:hypothetical protein